MRPTTTQRVAKGGWFLAHIAAWKLSYTYFLSVVLCSSYAPLVHAQQQREALLRPNQPKVVGGSLRGVQDNQQQQPLDAAYPRAAYPSEAWTSDGMPPLPARSGQAQSDPLTGGVVTAVYNQTPSTQARTPQAAPPSQAATAALRGQNAGADSPTRERTPLAQRSNSPANETRTTGSGGTLQMLMSVGSSLLIVVGLFLGVAWCYRKTLNPSSLAIPQQVVKVLGRTPLAARQQLLVVRFGSKLVLVSLVQGEARTLSEITDPLEVDQLAGMCESSQPGSISASFKSILSQGGATA